MGPRRGDEREGAGAGAGAEGGHGWTDWVGLGWIELN